MSSRLELSGGTLVTPAHMNTIRDQTYRIANTVAQRNAIPSPPNGLIVSMPSEGRVDIRHGGRWRTLWYAGAGDRSRIVPVAGQAVGLPAVYTEDEVITGARMNALNAAVVHTYSTLADATTAAATGATGTLIVAPTTSSDPGVDGWTVHQLCDVSSGSRLIRVSAPTRHQETSPPGGKWREVAHVWESTMDADGLGLSQPTQNYYNDGVTSPVERYEGVWGFGRVASTVNHTLGTLRYCCDLLDGTAIIVPRNAGTYGFNRLWRPILRRTWASGLASSPAGWTDIPVSTDYPTSKQYGESPAWNPWRERLSVLRAHRVGGYGTTVSVVLSVYDKNGNLLGAIPEGIVGHTTSTSVITIDSRQYFATAWTGPDTLLVLAPDGSDLTYHKALIDWTNYSVLTVSKTPAPGVEAIRGAGARTMSRRDGEWYLSSRDGV